MIFKNRFQFLFYAALGNMFLIYRLYYIEFYINKIKLKIKNCVDLELFKVKSLREHSCICCFFVPPARLSTFEVIIHNYVQLFHGNTKKLLILKKYPTLPAVVQTRWSHSRHWNISFFRFLLFFSTNTSQLPSWFHYSVKIVLVLSSKCLKILNWSRKMQTRSNILVFFSILFVLLNVSNLIIFIFF